MFIIPAIDILDGNCVRLTQGDYAQQTIYSSSPLDVAKQFEAEGLTRLHVVDLDGARTSHIVNYNILQQIATHTKLQIDFGGGIKSDADIQTAFESGAHQVTVGSIAVKSRETVLQWLEKYGAEKIILGADVKDELIAINGWQQSGDISLTQFLEYYITAGMQYVICTDIVRDGMLQGPAFSLYTKILKAHPQVKLIASGGISSLADLEQLQQLKLYGAITGKAIYTGKILLTDLKAFNNAG